MQLLANELPANTAPLGATVAHTHEKDMDDFLTERGETNLAHEEEEHDSSLSQGADVVEGEATQPQQFRQSMATIATTAMDEEENYPDPDSLQEELNEILEAWFELLSEEEIDAYQRYIEDIQGERVAERALTEPALAPSFSLVDQDDEIVHLPTLLRDNKKPVVLVFYRGKWCPHCNATLMRYQKDVVPTLQQWGVPLVAISPMLPDGTLYLASKRSLNFAVCSDPFNTVAAQFGITFQVQPHIRPFMEKWGEDLPLHNGAPDDWTLPIPAVYVIGTDGRIAWSFLDNDAGVRAEPMAILEAVSAAIPVDDRTITTRITLNASTSFSDQEQEAADCAPYYATSSQSGKKKKKLFNRKTGYVSIRKSCQGFISSLVPKHHRNRNDHDASSSKKAVLRQGVEQRPPDREVAMKYRLSSRISMRTSSRTSRTFRSSQSSMEFLTNYMLPSPDEQESQG